MGKLTTPAIGHCKLDTLVNNYCEGKKFPEQLWPQQRVQDHERQCVLSIELQLLIHGHVDNIQHEFRPSAAR